MFGGGKLQSGTMRDRTNNPEEGTNTLRDKTPWGVATEGSLRRRGQVDLGGGADRGQNFAVKGRGPKPKCCGPERVVGQMEKFIGLREQRIVRSTPLLRKFLENCHHWASRRGDERI